MEFLQNLLENSQAPFLTALILGLMTAISPCPLATNITAIGYIGKDLSDKKRVFINGIVYTLGRAVTYTAIGIILFFGADKMNLPNYLQQWGEKVIGPILIIIGLFMVGLIKISLPGSGKLSERMQNRENKSYWDVLLLGMAFALAFCPYSGILYFGMLIPITISSASGLWLPVIFAVATGIPVIIISWLIAFSMGSIGKFYNTIKIFEKWFRRVIAVVFIIVGIYYSSFIFM